MKDKRDSDSPVAVPGKDDSFELELQHAPIVWDLEGGNLTFFGIDSALFWTDPSLVRMFSPLVEEIGIDLFRLLVAHSSSLGTEEDYHAMVSTMGEDFADGFLAWGRAVSAAGWGAFEMPEYDPDGRKATVIIRNPWEISMQRSLPPEKRWGCPFLQGKIIGIFNHAFGIPCWADDTCHEDAQGSRVVFRIYASDKTIQQELRNLRRQRMVANERALAKEVERKTAELEDARIRLEEYSKTLEQKVDERTDALTSANRQLQKEIQIRRRAEESLIKSRDTLNNILTASPIGIGLVENRVLKWANEAMGSMLEFASDADYSRLNTRQFYATEDEYHRVGESVYRKLRTGEPAEEDVILKRKDGSTFNAHLKMTCQDPSNPMERAIITISDITWRKQAESQRERLIDELQTALSEVKTLRGIIPICSNCKKIRDDEGYWQQVEKYIQDRSDAAFSHGICQECAKKLYPDL